MKSKFRQINMVFFKSLTESMLSQIKRFFASLRMTSGEGLAFLLQIKSSLSCSSRQKNEYKQNGFTLLEVLIALVILSVGLLGMASLTASVIRTNSFSDDYTTSATLAQDKLEELVNTSFGSLASGNDTVGADGAAGTKYTRTWTVGAGTATKTIQVNVAWTNDTGVSKSINVYTIKSSQ